MPSLISLQERHKSNKLIMLSSKVDSGEYKIAALNCDIIAGQIKSLEKTVRQVSDGGVGNYKSKGWPLY